MSARQLVPALVVAGLVVLFVGFVAAASAGTPSAAHWDGDRTNDDRESEYRAHMSVHGELSADGSALHLDVRYSGSGEAVLVIEAVEGSYAGEGTYRINGSERVTLPVPEAGTTLRVTVKTEYGSQSAIVDVREMPCDYEEAREEWRSAGDDRRSSGERHVRLYVPSEDCEKRTPWRPTPTREDPRETPTRPPGEREPRPTPTATDRPGHDDVHETYNDTHDEAIDRYNDTHDGAIGLYEQAHDAVWSSYERARGTVWGLYEAVTSGDDGDGSDPVEHVRDDAGQVEDDVRNDAEHVREDLEDDAERVCRDARQGVDRVRDDANSDVDRLPKDLTENDSPDQSVRSSASPVRCSSDDPSAPSPPETPGRPGDGDDNGSTPEVIDRPDAPDLPDGGSAHASAEGDVAVHQEGTDARVEGHVNGAVSYGDTGASAERSVEADTAGSTDADLSFPPAVASLIEDLAGLRKSI